MKLDRRDLSSRNTINKDNIVNENKEDLRIAGEA